MEIRELAVEGALEFTPSAYPDERGLFVAPFQGPALAQARGQGTFPVRQANQSRSRRGALRGIHYTRTPPGVAKYVSCAHGRALDIVVDLRVGSPTYGRWECVEMNQESFRSVYFPVGVGHAFIALEDDTVMSYMLNGSYVAENELAVSALDPRLALPIPDGLEMILSPRDRVAISLEDAARQGLLPEYDRCVQLDAELLREGDSEDLKSA